MPLPPKTADSPQVGDSRPPSGSPSSEVPPTTGANVAQLIESLAEWSQEFRQTQHPASLTVMRALRCVKDFQYVHERDREGMEKAQEMLDSGRWAGHPLIDGVVTELEECRTEIKSLRATLAAAEPHMRHGLNCLARTDECFACTCGLQTAWDAARKSLPENVNVDLPDTAAQDSASKSNNPAVSG